MLTHAEPERAWTPDEVSSRLGSPRRWAEVNLEELEDAGLLAGHGTGWRFAPASPGLAQATDALAVAYRDDLRAVVRFIFAGGVRSSVE